MAKEKIFSSFLTEKLLTPMDFVRPSLWHSSMASQTDLKFIGITSSSLIGNSHFSGLTLTGQ